MKSFIIAAVAATAAHALKPNCSTYTYTTNDEDFCWSSNVAITGYLDETNYDKCMKRVCSDKGGYTWSSTYSMAENQSTCPSPQLGDYCYKNSKTLLGNYDYDYYLSCVKGRCTKASSCPAETEMSVCTENNKNRLT